MDAALSLHRHGPLGRFDAPVEAEYQRWLEHHLRPLAIVLAGISALAWFTAATCAPLFAKDDVDLSVVVIMCCFHVVAITAGTIWVWRTDGRNVVALAAVGIGFTAVDSVLLLGPAMNAGTITYIAGGMSTLTNSPSLPITLPAMRFDWPRKLATKVVRGFS